ncbi:MAG: hypothetical protein QM484_14510 [Woeseiaceae bacterium]
MKYIHLRKFKKEELIFDNQETVIILKFIFKNKHGLIDGLEINDRIREFAQGLLLEAVDASYALGFIHALFGGVFNPGAGAKKVFMKFARKALKHWFKHASAKDLMNIKIYDIVRRQLVRSFSSKLDMYASGVAMNKIKNSGFINYSDPSKTKKVVWG